MAILESDNGYYLWNYVPSLPGAVIFTVFFFTMSVLHFLQLFKTGTKFCWPFALGCICTFKDHISLPSRLLMIGIVEAIGYGARAAAVNDTGSLGPYIIQSIFILVPPAFFAATIYMTLSRTIRCVKGEHLSLARITWLTKVFVIGDILSFWVQGGSAGLTIHSNTAKIGQDMVIGGLGIQIISFGVFFLTAVIFHIRISKQPSRASYHTKAPWKQTLHMLYAVSVLILIRSVFRVVEYVQGQSGYSLKHE
jgi:hypothetical protein